MSGLCLGFDTSCYTTSVACVDLNGIVLDERTVLSVPLGGRGLRQSDGLFQHNRNLPVLLECLYQKVNPKEITAVAVSASPTAAEGSYMPVFLAGKLAAKAVSGALSVPLIETTHQNGHVRAALFGGNEHLLNKESFLSFHVSGGTTDVLLVKTEDGRIRSLTAIGRSTDLHAGQMVDRVAVSLGLPFPGGKHLEELANGASVRSIRIASAVRGTECSFSGAESEAARLLAKGERPEEIAFAVYDCLSRTLSKLIVNAREASGCEDVLLSGGVTSSALLRGLLYERMNNDRHVLFGLPALSSDNAVGAALTAGDFLWNSRN